MTKIRITRSVRLPDPLALARCRRGPELGPRILFFSGGTALRGVSRRLIRYTHNSIHLITPFDSGGSSATLRRAFGMLAVGDLRNRLMALADHSVKGQPEVFDLFAFRFPTDDGPAAALDGWLDAMVVGRDRRIAVIEEPLQTLIRNHLGFFRSHMPEGFDLRGANIGNLILAGGYLNHRRDIEPVLFLFSKLVEVRGVVRPSTDADLHLAAELEDGSMVVGQHRMTGKTAPPLPAPIKRLMLSRSLDHVEPAHVSVDDDVAGLIRQADLICFPMGSFYTSLLANLLVDGIGQSIAETDVPKVFIPNTGRDPEQAGLTLADQVRILTRYLQASCNEPAEGTGLLQFVLLDAGHAGYTRSDLEAVERLGPKIIDVSLGARADWRLDDGRVGQTLVSMA